MLEIPNELLAHLERSGTVLVPSRQRAVALRLAYSNAMLARGLAIWDSPDVLPWGAWIERTLDQMRGRGQPLPQRLSATEDWLLWREAVREACRDQPVLMPDGLIGSVRRALSLLDDYGIVLRQALSAESAMLLRARDAFQRRCQQLDVVSAGDWPPLQARQGDAGSLLVAGFDALGPARVRWLESIGARIWEPPAESAGSSAVHVQSFESSAAEAAAAAEWCAQRLSQDSAARLLLVVPRLSEQRHLWQRALSERLEYPRILAADDAPGSFAIEGGLPLADYPLVSCALHALQWACGPGDFLSLSALLRSPYWGHDGSTALRLDVWLRQRNLNLERLDQLAALRPALAAALGETAAVMIDDWLGALQTPSQQARMAPAGEWAQSFARLLQRLGWPGSVPLGSQEQQIRQRFDEVLGEFALVRLGASRLTVSEAADLLAQMLRRTAFEPASDDVPITVTASLEHPIVRYDGIWVAGLSADAWPAPSRPDPLLPLALQREAGVPSASAAGQLQLALSAQRHWQLSSAQLVLSYATSDADLPRDQSALLTELPSAQPLALAEPFEWSRWLSSQAPPLQQWRDDDGPAWPAGRALRGGARLLELQSLCPFHAFAELRLAAPPLPLPAPGIDARLRGEMLHRALELFWGQTRDSRTLHARGAAGNAELAHELSARAIEQVARRSQLSLDPALLRREAARTERLLLRLIEWDLQREGFEATLLEGAQPLMLAGVTLGLRLDRLDRLGDGRLAVIDYKSGAASAFDAFAERPPQPQLPAYALLAGADSCAVAALHLGRDGLKLRGTADRADRLPGLAALEDAQQWPQLQQHWRQRLSGLLQEFLAGHAPVQPQAHACERCHLQLLCRIDAAAAASGTPLTVAAQDAEANDAA